MALSRLPTAGRCAGVRASCSFAARLEKGNPMKRSSCACHCRRRIARHARPRRRPPATPSSSAAARSTTARAARPYVGDVALKGDRIVYVGPHAPGPRRRAIVDATGKAVSPGFINMLSWANESLIADGRGLSDTAQGVTLEVMGEGDSMGPWTPEMKRLAVQRQGDIKYPIRWTTLGEYLDYHAAQGRHAQRRLVRRRDHRARARARREGRRSDARRSSRGCARWSGRR